MADDVSESASVTWDGATTNLDRAKRLDGDSANTLLRAAIESANDAIVITEANLNQPGPRIEYVNAAFTRMTGYGVDEIAGQSPRVLQGPRTDRELMRQLRVDLQASKSFHGETVNYRKDGTEYHVEWRITPLTNDRGEVIKWVAIQRDVTARVLAEIERAGILDRERRAREEAEHQGRVKDEFLATLSHELRTPLNAIVGWSQMLLKGKAGADPREAVTIIERNARAQAKLIEDLLDMSRIITGKIRLDVQTLELATVIDAAVTAVRHAAEQKNVRLQVVVDPLAGPIAGDPNRMQQVIWNLLSNAVKFTSAGGRVQVICERVNSHVEIAVSDTGIGIAPENLSTVFERFRQVDSSTTRRSGGLGLGLSIVKHLVELHGGEVRAKSPGDGQGATFIVAMPVAISLDQPGDIAPVRRPDPGDHADAECPPTLTNLRVLIVEDEPDARLLMRHVLESCGAIVAEASMVVEALKVFDTFKPDVLISDIGMPERDGYSLIREIRTRSLRDGGGIPALAVTAFARTTERRHALRSGFDFHIAKPVDPEEIIEVVARLATRAR